MTLRDDVGVIPRESKLSSSAYATPGRLLAGVCGGFALACLVAVPLDLPLGWDEIVYVSQHGPHAPPAFMSAPRSRGVTLLAGPIATWTDSTVALRLYLLATAVTALGLAFWPWTQVLRRPFAAPLAAGFYGSLWFTVFYANEAMPNHYTAMAAVGAVGCLLRAASASTTRAPYVGLVAALALAGLMRPSDAAMLGLVLVAVLAVVPAMRRWRLAAAVVGGLALGVLPWVVEAQLRYGGLLERVRESSDAQGSPGVTFSLGTIATTLDGPLLCRPCADPVRELALLWWVAVGVLVPVGMWAAHRAGQRLVVWLPLAASAAMAVPYVFFIDYSAPRFLSATYALAFIPAAWGLIALFEIVPAGHRRRALSVLLALSVVVHLAIQGRILILVTDNQVAIRRDWIRVADALHSHGIRPPCVVTGDESIPIAYYARCRAMDDRGNNRNTTTEQLRRAAQTQPFAIVIETGSPPGWAAGWQHIRVPTQTLPGWTIYVPR